MVFCPFRSNADKTVTCNKECALYLKKEYEENIGGYILQQEHSYCAITYMAMSHIPDGDIVKDVNYVEEEK